MDTVLLLGMAFLMLWAGLTLLISALGGRRGRPALIGRLRSYQYLVGDKAEEWLQSQG